MNNEHEQGSNNQPSVNQNSGSSSISRPCGIEGHGGGVGARGKGSAATPKSPVIPSPAIDLLTDIHAQIAGLRADVRIMQCDVTVLEIGMKELRGKESAITSELKHAPAPMVVNITINIQAQSDQLEKLVAMIEKLRG